MSAIDAYGDFELPEEKSSIEVVEDPVKAVISTHNICKKIFEKQTENEDFFNWGNDDEFINQLYNSYVKTFEGKENLKADEKQTKEILEYIKKNDVLKEIEPIVLSPSLIRTQHAIEIEEAPTSFGIFLSALQNATKIDDIILEDFPYNWHAGYKLKKDKYLIIGPKTKTFKAGTYGEGILINNGYADIFGDKAQSGIYINNEKIEFLGWNTKAGLFVNNKKTQHTASYCFGGTYSNNGETKYLGHEINEQKSTVINNGKITEKQTLYDKLHIPYIDLIPKTQLLKKIINFITRKQTPTNPLKQKLDDKLKEIAFTKILPELSYEEQIKKVREFD